MNMCGIFALLNSSYENNEPFPSNIIINEFEKGKRRGPENSTLKTN